MDSANQSANWPRATRESALDCFCSSSNQPATKDQTRITNNFFANLKFFLANLKFFSNTFCKSQIFLYAFCESQIFWNVFKIFYKLEKSISTPSSDFWSNLERKLIFDNEICTFRASTDTKTSKIWWSTICRWQTGPEIQKHTDNFDVFPVPGDPFDITYR